MRVKDPEPGKQLKKLPTVLANPSLKHCWFISSFSPVLAAIDLAIAMASRTPKKAIARALPESSRTIVQSQTGKENHGSFLGMFSVSLTLDPPEGSIQ